MTKPLTNAQKTPEARAARKAVVARYIARHAERISREKREARAKAAMPTLSIVQSAQINSPTSVWAYAARSAS